MVPISERPPQVEDRAVPGHWEGDLLVGGANRSFVATLVERQTRYVMLARLGTDGTTEHVIEALKQRIRELPSHLVVSFTWDQGKELSSHARFRAETGIEVYFCDPTRPGSGARTRTPTASCANTCPRAPTSPRTARPSSTRSRPS